MQVARTFATAAVRRVSAPASRRVAAVHVRCATQVPAFEAPDADFVVRPCLFVLLCGVAARVGAACWLEW